MTATRELSAIKGCDLSTRIYGIYIIYVNVLNFNKNVTPENNCNPFNPITYLHHYHMSMFLISIRMSHLKTIATRLIVLFTSSSYVNVLNFDKNVTPENNCNPFNPNTYLHHYHVNVLNFDKNV